MKAVEKAVKKPVVVDGLIASFRRKAARVV